MLAYILQLRLRMMPVIAALVLIFACSSKTTAQIATNPHWSKDNCVACHAGKPQKIPAGAVTALCLSCHDGVHASDEAHPVGRVMDASLVDPKWPTVSGTVQCLTCHDVKQQCDPTAERPQDNASFLRTGADDQTPFCANCHRDPQVTKFNPHRMLQAHGRTPIQQKCDVCHDKPMDNTAMVRTANPSLRADLLVLCKSCHPHHKDISPLEHLQTMVPTEMLAYMRARELTGLIDSPSPDLLKQLKTQKATPTLMMPDAQGRITCTTCHNPHQQGTFPPDSVLADRSLRLMKDHLITPIRGELFCRHCHNL